RTNAVLRVMQRDAAGYAWLRRRVPSGTRGSGVEDCKLPRSVCQEFAPKQIGIGSSRNCHLIDETFLEERVLGMVDAAPNPDRNGRVAHGEMDEVVRHRIGHVLKQALEEIPVDAELHPPRRHGCNDGLTRRADFPRGWRAVPVETGGEPR